jgi:hypothetical protein
VEELHLILQILNIQEEVEVLMEDQEEEMVGIHWLQGQLEEMEI